MKLFVQIIGAPWCKRCLEVKPRVSEVCRLSGATLEEVNYDELEEDDSLKASVSALPTVRLLIERDGHTYGSASEWKAYKPSELDAWEDMMKVTALSLGGGADMDF